MSVAYLIGSGVTAIALHYWAMNSHDAIQQYLEKYHNLLLPQFVVHTVLRHLQLLWIVLLVLFVMECCRWQLFQSYQRQQHQRCYDSTGDEDAPRRNRNYRRWWSTTREEDADNNNDLNEPFLATDDWDRFSNSSRGGWWSFFQRRRHRTTNNYSDDDDDNLRNNDEDARLFANIQQEWAIRTEEDPIWWSRDEEEIQNDLDDKDSSDWASTSSRDKTKE
jgi:hypothetical protein